MFRRRRLTAFATLVLWAMLLAVPVAQAASPTRSDMSSFTGYGFLTTLWDLVQDLWGATSAASGSGSLESTAEGGEGTARQGETGASLDPNGLSTQEQTTNAVDPAP